MESLAFSDWVSPLFKGHLIQIVGFIYLIIQITGFYFAITAVISSRSPQGSIAWALSLVTFPLVSIPLFVIFGTRRFQGYIEARRKGEHAISKVGQGVQEILSRFEVRTSDSLDQIELQNLAMLPMVGGNKLNLLIDGRKTFNAIFNAIEQAEHTLLIQFYIVRNDHLGRRLKDLLIKKINQGVEVYFIYDEIGSYFLSPIYVRELRQAGANIFPFATTLGRISNPFQLNFRNHRKIVVIDGNTAFVGGHNVGDEYLGENPKRGPWRDTHLMLEGPIVKGIQLAFLMDWHWVSGNIPNFPWEEVSAPGGVECLCIPSGPSDQVETCALLFISIINSATRRIWITSPYFVPDKPLISALSLAVLRGVDVRIMLPEKFDSKLIQMASENYIEECLEIGVKIYRYQEAFLHQKVALVDDDITLIGTANFDNRSFHLNFEISIYSRSRRFASQVEHMLSEDFENCRNVVKSEYENTPLFKKFIYRLATLFSPVL